MNQLSANEILNRVLILHHRSLPIYLRDAHPWMTTASRDSAAWQTLDAIIRDQQQLEDEMGRLLNERDFTIHYGEFPIRFTAYNDLSFSFLLKKLIEHGKSHIKAIEVLLGQLRGDELARSLIERALGSAKAHLESLQELAPTATGVAN